MGETTFSIDPRIAVWGSIALTLFAVISLTLNKSTGVIESWGKVVDAWRRTAADGRTAEFAALDSQLKIVQQQLDAVVRELHSRNAAAERHTEWDNEVRHRAALGGVHLPPMPSLYDVIDTPLPGLSAAETKETSA